jgi:hypothetical protein
MLFIRKFDYGVRKYVREVFLKHFNKVSLSLRIGEWSSIKNIFDIPIAFNSDVGNGDF